MISNWKNYKLPWQSLDTFTRHEPFPSEEVKATFMDGRRKPRKSDRKGLRSALQDRWKKGA